MTLQEVPSPHSRQ